MEQIRRQKIALTAIRVFLAATMIVHAVARIYAGGVAPFGEFLTAQGLPYGFYLAWVITVFEIVGGIALAIGYFVPVLAVIFALHLLAGIILVHARDGWFVVGLGRNGAEYSTFLIVSFLLVAFSHYGAEEPRRRIRY
jgi:putative oxidoreductase